MDYNAPLSGARTDPKGYLVPAFLFIKLWKKLLDFVSYLETGVSDHQII
jgi:hypothetical protein